MPRTVLVVDDEDDVRELTRLSLERVGGMTVLTARSAQEAVDVLDASPVDIVLLDVMMPDTDGPTALHRLRQTRHGAGVHMVFFTASVQEEQVAALRRLDVLGVLAKPFDPLTLPSMLHELAGWS